MHIPQRETENRQGEVGSLFPALYDRPQQPPPAEGYGDQSAGNPETRDAIHSGASLIIPPLVGSEGGQAGLRGSAAAGGPVRLYNKRPKKSAKQSFLWRFSCV
jgi:hypothetical protein